eukprot:6832385-Prymnesium_polylepis.2
MLHLARVRAAAAGDSCASVLVWTFAALAPGLERFRGSWHLHIVGGLRAAGGIPVTQSQSPRTRRRPRATSS